ncbi:MAG: guanylate kinase, partial [Erysipelotrichaceae bacterium]
PPSMDELERRIRGRRSEPEEIVQKRLGKAAGEINKKSEYQYVVCNDTPEQAAAEISTIIRQNMGTEVLL